jgi:hypothetical protein
VRKRGFATDGGRYFSISFRLSSFDNGKSFKSSRKSNIRLALCLKLHVRKRGFEPPHPYGRYHLKVVRLPFRHLRMLGVYYISSCISIIFMIVYLLYRARLAQLVEQLIYTEKVGGSSPSSRTGKKNRKVELYDFFYYATGTALRQFRVGLEKLCDICEDF